jgi:hypothetical protein
MSRSLFEEAIADAKQLREVAELNAKNAIIEAVTPKIREFIESQLVGETPVNEDADFLATAISEEDGKAEGADEEVALDETALRSLVDLMNGSQRSSAGKNDDLAALSEAFDSLSEEEQGRLLALIKEGESEETETVEASGSYEVDLEELKKSVVSETESKAKGAKMNKVMDEELYELDEMMHGDEDDLEEAVLKLVGTAEEKEAFDKLGLMGIEFEETEGEEEEVEVGEEEAEAAPVEPAAEAGAEEGDEEALAEMVYEIDENMLRRELARLREAKSRKKGSSEKSHKVAAAAFGGGTLEGDAMDVNMNELDLAKKKIKEGARENHALKNQLNDYRGAIETLREQLSDLNLFNAKLLYVNKILQNKDVAPNQRRAIIEALDGASNLREAKLLFESLTTSITSKNESLNESVKHTAGLASRPVTSSSARMNGAGEVDRWATLAGLK